MEIPNKYELIVKEILQQLEEFERAYGTIPKVRLVTQSNYDSLIRLIQDYQQPKI